jgi:hypothetical protein
MAMNVATTAASSRAPRGTKILTQAFFAAADDIPEAQRAAVVKAALTAIRDQIKNNRDRAKAARAAAKAKLSRAPASRRPKRAAAKAAPVRKAPANGVDAR